MTQDSHTPSSGDGSNSAAGDTPSVGEAVDQERSEAVEGWLEKLLGASLSAVDGVLQTAAVWRRPGSGELVVLRICDETPKSATDFLLLQLGRARADAIVTTGKILRDEPELDFSLGFEHDELPSSREHLAAWRSVACDRSSEPRILVLSSGRDLPLHHPALEGRDVTVFTGAQGEERLASAARAFGIEVAVSAEPGLLSALAWLAERGLTRVTVEAGPSTSIALYDEQTRVDALSLSTLQHGPGLSESLQGGSFLSGAELHERLEPVREATTVDEAGETWSFQLWRARE